MKLGATGEFPRGKLNQDDEGELQLAILVRDNTVVIEFGKSVKWIGLDADGAIEFANLILAHANEIKSR
jgi:hypothetical protein